MALYACAMWNGVEYEVEVYKWSRKRRIRMKRKREKEGVFATEDP